MDMLTNSAFDLYVKDLKTGHKTITHCKMAL